MKVRTVKTENLLNKLSHCTQATPGPRACHWRPPVPGLSLAAAVEMTHQTHDGMA